MKKMLLLLLLLLLSGINRCTTSINDIGDDGGSITVTTAKLVKFDDKYVTIFIPNGTCSFYMISKITTEYFIEPIVVNGPDTLKMNRSFLVPGTYVAILENHTSDLTYSQEVIIYK